MKDYLSKSTGVLIDELSITLLRIKFSDNDSIRYKGQVEKSLGLINSLCSRFNHNTIGNDIANLIYDKLYDDADEAVLLSLDFVELFLGAKSIGDTIQELALTNLLCWQAQEDYRYKDDLACEDRLKLSDATQILNAQRTEWILKIDEMLNESYRSVATKTYKREDYE